MNEFNPFDDAFEPIHHWLKTLPWWLAIGVFVGYAAFLFLLQWGVFRFLRHLTRGSSRPLLSLIIGACQDTVVLFLLSGTVSLLPPVLKIPKEWRLYFYYSAKFLAILAIAIFIDRLLLAAYRRYVARDDSQRAYSGLIRVLISISVYSLFLMIFLDSVGVSITPLIASLGVSSVAVAFALQQTLASLFAGLFIVTDKPIRVGDYVRLESGGEGYVQSIGWRTVRIRMMPDNILIVPNSKLASDVITNFSMPDRELMITVDLGVDYASRLDKVEQVTLEVARDVQQTVPEAVPDFEPSIRWKSFGDSSINFQVIIRSKDFISQYPVRNAFIKKIHERYRKEGINIPFPIRTILTAKSN